MREEGDGKPRQDKIDPKSLDGLRRRLDRFWKKALAAFRARAEQHEDEK
jgi:hypothetical protein